MKKQKFPITLLFILTLLSCSTNTDQKAQFEEIVDKKARTLSLQTEEPNWHHIGQAYMGADRTSIILGDSYNIVESEENGPIKYLNNDYEAAIEQISEDKFIITPEAEEGANIILDNIMIEENKFLFDFKITSELYSMEEFEPAEIIIADPERHYWWPVVKQVVKEIVKGIIVNEVSESLTDSGSDDEDCTAKAQRGCGEGNIAWVDEGGWFSGCSYGCK